TKHDMGDLSRGLAIYGEQQHLKAVTRFGLRGVIVAMAQLGQCWFVQWRECYGSSHLSFPFFTLPHFSLPLYHISAHFTWKHLADLLTIRTLQRESASGSSAFIFRK